MSSNKALQIVKRLYHAKKAGHTGTLDPLASGLLPICLNEATKFTNFILNADKDYVAEIKFGIITDSADITGNIIKECVSSVDIDSLTAVLIQLTGEQLQIPPAISALKHNGVPLYKIARSNHTAIDEIVKQKQRLVTIFELKLLNFDVDKQTCLIYAKVSKGTYIRSIAHQIGHKLGCGACVSKLHRSAIQDLSVNDSYTLEQLDAYPLDRLNSCLIPIDYVLKNLPKYLVSDTQMQKLQFGNRVDDDGMVEPNNINCAMRAYYGHDFIGIVKVNESRIVEPVRLLSDLVAMVNRIN